MPLDMTVLRASNSRDLSLELERIILAGGLAAGEQLPSIRALATATSMSPTTVAAALRSLSRKGLVASVPRRGVLVASREGRTDRSGLRDLRHGGPDPLLLPDLRPALREATEELTAPRSYSFPLLDPDLGRVARDLFLGDGIPVDQVVACSGALDGIQRALTVHLAPGDLIALEDPGYADHYELVRSLGLRPLAVPMDDEGPTPGGVEAAIRAGARAMIVTPAGQNPFGSLMSHDRAGDLRSRLVREQDLLVLEDQHLSPLIANVPTLAGCTARWAVVRTLAKALGADVRVALLTGDSATAAAVAERIAVGPGWTSHILQRTAFHLLTSDAVRRGLRETAETYDRRRTALLDALRMREIDAFGRSGLNVWIPVPDEGEIAVRLAQGGWTVATGSAFRIESRPAIRVTTSTLRENDAPAVADDIAHAMARDVGRRG